MSSTDITRSLAAWAVSVKPSDIPSSVRREGVRSLVNWLGCAVGGASHEAVERALAAVEPFSGPRRAGLLGRPERLDELHCALINGISSHVLDYDDTHLKTIIHPAGPVASAVLAIAEGRNIPGRDIIAAFVVGMEVECRIGNCIYPDHYDRGWHITATAGVFGAAAAVGRLLGLDTRAMSWALGLAATQASGLREMFGTMTKSFHPGRAAQNGAMAALLAEAGFDSSERAIEAPRGFAQVLSDKQDYTQITHGLGTVWESALNTYKPFACGIVLHPAIDACCRVRDALGEVPDVERVELRVNPLVLELTGKKEPATGLESKFSVYHAVACALLNGDGSPSAFTDEAVRDPAVLALRDRVTVHVDRSIHEASVSVSVLLKDGSRIAQDVEHALGSLERPLTDSELDAKFLGQAIAVLGEAGACKALELAWNIEGLESLSQLVTAARPEISLAC